MKRAIALLSGGLDSATAAAQAIVDGFDVIGLSFRYGQRHQREIEAAREVAEALNLSEHIVMDINLAQWGGSSLTDISMNVPTDGINLGVIPSTYVPGRNTVFIAVALSLAEAREAEAIYLGINAVDYSGYPDCRPEYLAAYQALADVSNKAALEGNAIRLIAPFEMDSKADIVRRSIQLGVPVEMTWSCYLGEQFPCGECDSCRIRDAAFVEIGRVDLTSSSQTRRHKEL